MHKTDYFISNRNNMEVTFQQCRHLAVDALVLNWKTSRLVYLLAMRVVRIIRTASKNNPTYRSLCFVDKSDRSLSFFDPDFVCSVDG